MELAKLKTFDKHLIRMALCQFFRVFVLRCRIRMRPNGGVQASIAQCYIALFFDPTLSARFLIVLPQSEYCVI